MSKKEELKEVKFKLPTENTEVIVKHIPRKKGMSANVAEDHIIAGGMVDQAVRSYIAPLLRNGSVANILTNEEKEVLEDKTGLNLSSYGEFWETFSVKLRKDSANNRFDISRPMDYIAIKILEANKDEIAPSWNERDRKQTYTFVITKGGEEDKEKKRSYDSKKEAFKQYGKIEDDKDKLIGILKLISNKPISKDSKLTWLQGKVEELIDTMPSSFLDIINDSTFDTKVLINRGVDAGVIDRKGNKYSTIDGLDLCEADEIPTFNNAVRYLDHPKNQEVRSLIEAKINI